jgi:uncharacterized protein Yka (UPF0111/DUF47 family)
MPKRKGITSEDLLAHMQNMQRVLLSRIEGVEKSLGARMDRLEKRMDRLEEKIDRVERNLTNQIDAIDQRLDAIEIELLPKRVARLEKHMGLAAA